ncbi:MAG: 2-C-methyl-D-erythritol 4-phosphate cytidylyltransferase [Boseongicola sp.]|nr:2-C-methyl-D-erythritol 4-phosphate cytidylyltransferase [Boseongicola sp.]
MTATAFLIVAAGRGLRIGGDVPKQYIDLGGKVLLRHTIERVLACPATSCVLVVIGNGDHELYRDATEGMDRDRLLDPVVGGDTRAKSVRAGLEALVPAAPDFVLIHDAARPFVSPCIIREVIAALKEHDGAFPALPVVDALWLARGGIALEARSRNDLWRAQTPQGFKFKLILEAHRNFPGDAADDVEVARAAGLDVRVVEGSEANIKVTTPDDLARARILLDRFASLD